MISVCFVSVTVHADTNDSSLKVTWGYKGNIGPERWGQLDPGFVTCLKGKAQSPIDITKKVINAENSLKLNYSSAPLDIVNDGTTELQIDAQQTIIHDGHSVQVNFSPDSNETIIFGGNNYRLREFHIHTPSENEWHGRSFPLEIHFVHQGDQGKLLVIGVFAKGGDENTELQKVVTNLPNDKGQDHIIPGAAIMPLALMPVKQDYYSYAGSLTTPPCTEGVQWIVMANPITLSPAQIAILKRAIGGVNARPVQPLNKRVISYSLQTK